MSDIRVTIHSERLNRALELLAPTAQTKLSTFLVSFSVRLLGQIRINIAQLFRSTGPLYNSVTTEVRGSTVIAATRGIPYARIQEEGGRTPPHVILPRTASVLAFEGPAGLVFAKRVNHPGANIPARPYVSLALTQMRGEFSDGIRDVVAQAKGELL